MTRPSVRVRPPALASERLLEVVPEHVDVLDTDAEPEQPARYAVALVAVARLDRRADAAEARRVPDQPRRRLDAACGVRVGDVEREEPAEAAVHPAGGPR